jgi:hypothetical protein
MASFRDYRLLLILMLAFFVVWIVAGLDNPNPETDPQPSSYNATYPGFKAWYLLLQDLGNRPRRLAGSFARLQDVKGSLVLADPAVPVTSDEFKDLIRWVGEGGRLFYCSSVSRFNASGAAFDSKLGLKKESTAAANEPLPPTARVPLTRYVGNLYGGGRRFTRFPKNATALYKDKEGAKLIEWRVGKGEILAMADPFPLSNQFIDRQGNARLGVWIAREGPVTFDEYHQGYQTVPSGPTLWGQLGAPLRLALYQIALAALLMGWTLSRRFGEAASPPFENRRTAGEYVVSLGQLLRRAHGDRAALEIIGRSFRQDLAAWIGAPADTPDDLLLEAVADRSNLSPERIREALAASHGLPPKDLSPLDACRLIAAVREELNLHGRFAASPRNFA